MVKFSLSRNFPDLEIHDHNTRVKNSHEIPWPCKLHVLTPNECHGYRIFHSWLSCTRGPARTPVIDEVLACEQERHNTHDPFAVVEGSLMAPGVRKMSY